MDEDKRIIAFLMLHGCRPGGASALRVEDVDLQPGMIAIHQEMLDYIGERVKRNLPRAFIFTNSKNGKPYSAQKLRKIWDKVREATGAGDEGLLR